MLPLVLSLPLAFILFKDEKEDRQLADVDTSAERSLMSWIWIPILIAIALCTVVIVVLGQEKRCRESHPVDGGLLPDLSRLCI